MIRTLIKALCAYHIVQTVRLVNHAKLFRLGPMSASPETATVSLIRGALHSFQKQQESTAAIFVVVLCSFESTVFASGEKKGVQTFDSIIRRFWVWSPNQAGSDVPFVTAEALLPTLTQMRKSPSVRLS